MDLVCVGDAMLDVRVDAAALRHGGDVHGRVRLEPGGTSANAAAWAAWAGAGASVVARVGDDVAGRTLLGELAARGVETRWVTTDREEPTGTMLVVHEAGDRSMVADRGANAQLAVSDLPETIEGGAVLVSGYLLLQDPGHDVALEAMARARTPLLAAEAASWPVLESFGVERFLEETASAGVRALLANEHEAEVLVHAEADAALHTLSDRFRLVAIKHGAAGATIALDGEPFSFAPEPVTEVDPTGAGDAFDGVLLASLARGAPAQEALALACRAGSLVASRHGVWPGPVETAAAGAS